MSVSLFFAYLRSMHADIDYIKEQFTVFNSLIFGGKLPQVQFKLGHGESYYGKLEYGRKRPVFGKEAVYGLTIRINAAKDLPKDMLDDVIIHEMIHLFIVSQGLKDSSAHGKIFRRMMEEINASYGCHVCISYKRDSISGRIRRHHVFICELEDGKTGICVCSAAMAPRIRTGLRRAYRTLDIRHYLSDDPHFNRFPHARKPRLYLAKADDLEMLKG